MKECLMITNNKDLLTDIYYIDFGSISNDKISIPLIATIDKSMPQKVAVVAAETEFPKFTKSFRELIKSVDEKFKPSFSKKPEYFGDFALDQLSQLNNSECKDLRLFVDELSDRINSLTKEQVAEIQSYTSVKTVHRLLKKYLIDSQTTIN